MFTATLSPPPANGDWLELLFPILLIVVYGAATLVKAFVEKRKEDASRQDLDVPSRPERRYKPLDQVANFLQTPQQRTLPYARTAAKRPEAPRPSVPSQPQTAMPQSAEHQLQQQMAEQRRLQQIEALRRQQLQRQEYMKRQQKAQQQAAQSVKIAQAATPRTPSGLSKTAQEALRQARTGKPVGLAAGRKTAAPKPPRLQPERVTAPTASMKAGSLVLLHQMLRSRSNLRTAFALKEILDPPVVLRND